MKTIIKILLSLFIVFSFLSFSTFASLWDETQPHIPYEQNCIDGDCLTEWIKTVDWIWALETERKASQYLQDVVRYLITFLTLIAVIYIIYAWFNILTWAWDEDKAKKSKNTILYVLIWIVLIWLAFPITKFIFDVLNWPSGN